MLLIQTIQCELIGKNTKIDVIAVQLSLKKPDVNSLLSLALTVVTGISPILGQ